MPEFLWELWLGIYLTLKECRPSPLLNSPVAA